MKEEEKEKENDDFRLNIHYHKEDEQTDNIKELEEDIPFKEDWKRISVVNMKRSISNWIEDNLEHESEENYDIYSKEDERRLYVKVHQENCEDEEDDIEHYFCIFEKHDTRKVEMTDVKF